MTTRLVSLTLSLLLFAACDNDPPCTNCPSLEGTYLFTWSTGSPQDGCPSMGPQPAAVTFTRQSAAASAIVDGVTLKGTIYYSNNFVLHAGTDTRDLTLHGFITDLGRDAGILLDGSLTTQTTGAKMTCSTRDTYMATKQ